MNRLRLLYRADGGHPVGTGHIWRAVRILRAMQQIVALEARLMFADDPFARRAAEQAPARPLVLPARADTGAVKPLLDAAPVMHELAREPADVVVVDMLDTAAVDMAEIAAAGVLVATLDDRGPGRTFAQLIINTLVEEREPGALSASTRLLEGSDYAVLDPIFAEAHASAPAPTGALRRVFVAMGGADAAGLTVKVAQALRMVSGLECVELVCGPAFPHRRELEEVVAGAAWQCEIFGPLPNLLNRYRACDLAVVAGGLTMYEVCCVGTPALVVCQPIDHQVELAGRLSAAGAMRTVGCGVGATVEQIAAAVTELAVSPTEMQAMAARGPALVDGRGTDRVARVIAAATLAAERRTT